MHTPDAEQQLLLLAAATASRRVSQRAVAVRLLSRIDWKRLTWALQERRLLATLGPRIIELSSECSAGAFSGALEQAIAQARRQDLLLRATTTQVCAALARAGIRSAALKGPLLGEAIYGEAGRRQSSDVDVLVDAEQLQSAVSVVCSLGFMAPCDRLEGGLPRLHFALAHSTGGLPPVELHWRVHWYEERFAHERLLPPGPQEAQWRAAPTDELAALLLCYARDGFIGLRLASDLSAWWDAFGQLVSRRALTELLGRYPKLAPAVLAALGAAERVVGLPGHELADTARAPRRARAAAALANPLTRGTVAQLHADAALVDLLLAPPGGTRAALRRQLRAPAQSVGERGQRRLGGAGHGSRVLARWLLRSAMAGAQALPSRPWGRLGG